MAGNSQNYRLTEGKLAKEVPAETQLWDAVNGILFSPKRSTYKFALLQAVIDLSLLDERTVFSLSDVFERVAAMYWRCLSVAALRQIHPNARYEQSRVEKIILAALSRFPGTSFSDIPDREANTICATVKRSCRGNVLGAAYGNSRGMVFGFSNDQDALELSLSSKQFLAQHASELSMYIEGEWLRMMEKLNPGRFPEPFAARMQTLDREIGGLFKKEGVPMTSSTPVANASTQGGLQLIQTYIEQAKAVLVEKTALLESAAAELEKELKTVFPGNQTEKMIFQSRVKGVGSLSEKIYRKNYHNRYADPEELINQLPDLIGVRIVCLLNQQEELVFHQLETAYPERVSLDGGVFFGKHGGRILFDFGKQPQDQKNGQPIYRITCKWAAAGIGYINCELQIKSMVHFFWGELDHMLFYKNYSYLISRSFYSQYMLKVEHALSNINDQLLLLQDQIEKDGESSRQEIREIASYTLYQHYHTEIESQIGCTVDLREVFALIVDMHFLNYGNQEANIKKLSRLLQDISGCSFCPKLLAVVMDGKLEQRVFTQEELLLARIIDQTIKAVDVYWIAFVVTYGSHFWDDLNMDYSQLLRRICPVLIRMLRNGFVDSVEYLDDDLDDLYEQFKSAILEGILGAFAEKPKLDFFIFSVKLDAVNVVS